MSQNEDHITGEDADPSRALDSTQSLPEVGRPMGGHKLSWGEGGMKNLIIVSMWWLCLTGCRSSPSPIFSIRARKVEGYFKKKAERLRQEDATRREAYLKKRPDLPSEIRQGIEGVAICAGMMKDQVRVAWGAPAVIQKHAREMWTYTGIDWWDYMGLTEDLDPRERAYVFFVNGRVTGWHDSLD